MKIGDKVYCKNDSFTSNDHVNGEQLFKKGNYYEVADMWDNGVPCIEVWVPSKILNGRYIERRKDMYILDRSYTLCSHFYDYFCSTEEIRNMKIKSILC